MNAQSSELNFPETYNLYMTSKNETMNSRIHEFKILQKGQQVFWNPFMMTYYILIITLKTFLSLAFLF